MPRLVLFLVLLALPFATRAQEAERPALAGRVDGRMYVSPTGQFKIAIPVLPELGGQVNDNPNVVTFQDDFNVHISIAAFPQDATQRWELTTRGMKDYLVYFFGNFVMVDFKQAITGAKIESAKFIPGLLDGVLLTYTLLPGGSMFADKIPTLATDETAPVAKRGNLVFVKNGCNFVISTELAERVIEGHSYKKTTAEEDELLRQRLTEILAKIEFAKPTPPPTLKK